MKLVVAAGVLIAIGFYMLLWLADQLGAAFLRLFSHLT